jgi:hypothetical protein
LYEQKVQGESQGSIKLLNFEKVNGQSMEFAGVKAYTFEFKGTVEFLEDGWWSGGGLMWDGNFYFARGNPSQMEMLLPPYVGTGRVKKGSHTDVSGKLEFMKTEKGWRTGKLILGEVEDPASLQMAILRQGALTGDVSAQMKLGTIYKTGDGVPKNLAEAKRWFEMAGQKGNTDAAREAALISLDTAVSQNKVLRSQAVSLQNEATLKECRLNLEVIGLQAHIWAASHDGKLPDYLIYLSNTIASPAFFHCPADLVKSIPWGTTYANFDPSSISYEMISPGMVETEQTETTVYVKCPIHGLCVLVNGKVVAGQ